MSKKVLKIAGRQPMLLALIVMATITIGLLFSGWLTPAPSKADNNDPDPDSGVETTNCQPSFTSTNSTEATVTLSNAPPIIICLGSSASVSTVDIVTNAFQILDTSYTNAGNSGNDKCSDTYQTNTFSSPTVLTNWWTASGCGVDTNGSGLTTKTLTPTNSGQVTVTFNEKWKHSLDTNTEVASTDVTITVPSVTITLIDHNHLYARASTTIASTVSCDVSDTTRTITVQISSNATCPVSLVVDSITQFGNDWPADSPPDSGILTDNKNGTWTYTPWLENDFVIFPRPMIVTVKPTINGLVAGSSVSFFVQPIYDHIKDGDSMCAYKFIRYRFSSILATTGGSFSSVTFQSPCSCGIFNPNVEACTTFPSSVTFDPDVFTGTQNYAASTVGHELKHTWDGGWGSECTAYGWEYNHAYGTGLYSTDNDGFLVDVVNQLASRGCFPPAQ